MTSTEDMIRQYKYMVEALQKEVENLNKKNEFLQAQLDVVKEAMFNTNKF